MERISDFYFALERAGGIKAVVFDMDDTLYPESDYVISGYRQAAAYAKKEYGIKNAYKKLITLFNQDKNGVFDRFAALAGAGENLAGEMLNVYRNQIPKITLYRPVKKLLINLRKRGYKIGLLTDGDPIRQRAKAASLGLVKYVDSFTFSGDFGDEYKKPSVVPFNDICKKLCVSPGEMIYVGDNPAKDFAVKRELEVFTLQVGGGLYSGNGYLFNIKPDFIIDKPLYEDKRKKL